MQKLSALTSYIKVAISCSVLLTVGCIFSAKPIYYDDDRRDALQHVERFHHFLDDKNYDGLYELFDSHVKNQQSKEQFVDALDRFRNEAGAFKSQVVQKADVTPQADYRVVHLILESTFENKTVVEEFDCFVDGTHTAFDFYGHPQDQKK